ncbi:unnamed protein product [Heligmosomoides polygyrus]|uniref:HTH_48 domain-containing protein n=1 Tax=Heligmosomoides polygyrus TaxID=6339 RepID=A0A183FV41_HELPZ|nr:unnamed protein product [Heligmosomoides polygyrus]
MSYFNDASPTLRHVTDNPPPTSATPTSLANTVFRKRDSHLVSYYSGSTKTLCGSTKIGFVIVRDLDRSLVTESNADLHPKDRPSEAEAGRAMRCTKNQVMKATDAIRQAAQSKLGITKVDKQAWLWKDEAKAKVQDKKSLYHVFLGEKTADNWRKYQEAKNAAKKAVAVAKSTHYGERQARVARW